MKQTTAVALIIAALAVAPSLAQEPNPTLADTKGPTGLGKPAEELAAIHAQSQAFVGAFNKGDAKAIASLWTEDGEYVDDRGRSFAGRDAIEKGYAQFFTENPGARIRITVDSLRLLSKDAAIEEGHALAETGSGRVPSTSTYNAIHVKVDGKWLMATVRDKQDDAPSASHIAADIEWLVGTWVAEEQGAKVESVCRWVANGRFLERKYTTTNTDGTSASGVQLIGWNPEGGYVQSWNFSPDGGHAVGIWAPTEGGWQAKVYGTTGDGTPTMAVNLLRRLDDNAYVWQSVQRFLGESALPDTDEIVIKRRPAAK